MHPSPLMMKKSLSDDGVETTKAQRDLIAKKFSAMKDQIPVVITESKDPKTQQPVMTLNERAFREQMAIFFKQKKLPFISNSLELAIYLCSFHTGLSEQVFEIAYSEAKLSQVYDLVYAVILLSANVGEFDQYGFPNTFNRDSRFNAAFRYIANLEFPEFDALIEKHGKAFDEIARKWLTKHPDQPLDHALPAEVEQQLFEKFTQLYKEVILKPEIFPDPIRYIMMNFSLVANKVAPSMPEEQRLSYFSIFLMTRFLIPRLTRKSMEAKDSPRNNAVKQFLGRYVSAQLQALATNPDKALDWIMVAKDSVKCLIKELVQFNPLMSDHIRAQEKWNDIQATVRASSRSPRRSKAMDLSPSQIAGPKLSEIEKLIDELKHSRSSQALTLIQEAQQLKEEVQATLVKGMQHWLDIFLKKTDVPQFDLHVQTVLAHHLQSIKQGKEKKDALLALLIAVSEQDDHGYCAHLIQFLEAKLRYSLVDLTTGLGELSFKQTILKTKIVGDLRTQPKTPRGQNSPRKDSAVVVLV